MEGLLESSMETEALKWGRLGWGGLQTITALLENQEPTRYKRKMETPTFPWGFVARLMHLH